MNAAPLTRQLGLTARHAVEGVAALPSILWNGPADAVNALAGTRIPRADIGPTLDAIGLPRANNPTELIAQDVVQAIAGTGGAVKLAQRASAGLDGPIARALAAFFADGPGVQFASAAGSAGAAGLARENGVGAMGQTLAALGGGLTPAAAGVIGPMAATARRASEQSKLAQTGIGPWGPVYGRLAGDPENAVAHLLNVGQGSVPAAATHPHAGAIELVAGQPVIRGGSGVLHVQAHGRDEALRRIPDLLKDGTWYGRVEGRRFTPKGGNPEQSFLSDGDYEAVLRNTINSLEGGVAYRNWMPTAYPLHPEMKIPLEVGQSARAPNFTQTAPPSSGTNGIAPTASGKSTDTARLSREGDTALSAGNLSIDEFLRRNPGTRDPRHYVGMDSPEQAAAQNAIAAQALRDVFTRALSGTAFGQAITTP